jgi:hypothetical protein
MKIEITLLEPMLGTLSGNPEIAKEFIQSKHPNGMQLDELHAETPEAEITKTSTVFPRENGKVFIWDYQIRGFFKEAFGAIIDSEEFTQEQLKMVQLTKYLHKRTVDNQIFVNPRKIFAEFTGETTWCERPLRCMTMQGERISVARSEELPAGTKFHCEIIIRKDSLADYITEALDYGQFKGLGQWRNSGRGRFEWKQI